MSVFTKLFRQRLDRPHRIHPSDVDLVNETDVTWYSNLRGRDVKKMSTEDDTFKMAAFLKFIDEGLSEELAENRLFRCFPVYYVDPVARNDLTSAQGDDDMKLPFLIKAKVIRLAANGELSRKHTEQFTSMNAAIRHVLRQA